MAGQLPGSKTENGGQTAQGRLSASEFNDMVQYIDDIPIANVVNAQEGKHITIEGSAVGNSQYPIAHANQAGYANTSGIAAAVGTAQSNLTKAQIESAINEKVPKTTTVNGHALSSNVTVTKGDVGLGNVDNTSDINKPISTATQTALDSKVSKVKVNGTEYASSGGIVTLPNYPSVPTVNNGTLTIQKNGTTVQTFSANQSGNATANITVPTNTSDLVNDSGFLTSHQDISGKADKSDTYTKTEVNTALDSKVDKVTGKGLSENDYTDSDKSDLDALVLHMPVYLTVTDYDIEEPEPSSGIWNYNATLVRNNPSHPFYIKITPESQYYVPCWGFATGSIGESNLTAHLYYQLEASGYTYFKHVTFTYDGIVNIVAVSRSVSASQISNWNSKQAALVSGTNIKTINDQSILGSGNLVIQGGGGTITDVQINGSTIVSSGVANIPLANSSTNGVISKAFWSNLSGMYEDYNENGFQEPLVSGTNIKTVNNQSLLGSGNIVISGGGGVQSNWNETDATSLAYIQNKPAIPYVPIFSIPMSQHQGYTLAEMIDYGFTVQIMNDIASGLITRCRMMDGGMYEVVMLSGTDYADIYFGLFWDDRDPEGSYEKMWISITSGGTYDVTIAER